MGLSKKEYAHVLRVTGQKNLDRIIRQQGKKRRPRRYGRIIVIKNNREYGQPQVSGTVKEEK